MIWICGIYAKIVDFILTWSGSIKGGDWMGRYYAVGADWSSAWEVFEGDIGWGYGLEVKSGDGV